DRESANTPTYTSDEAANEAYYNNEAVDNYQYNEIQGNFSKSNDNLGNS
ncbi:22467_t:CDS:1, partial [Gigaspora rosea]